MTYLTVPTMTKTRAGLIRVLELDLIADLAAIAAASVFHDAKQWVEREPDYGSVDGWWSLPVGRFPLTTNGYKQMGQLRITNAFIFRKITFRKTYIV